MDMDTEIEALATNIVDAAVKVHSALGPGLLESAYQRCLAHELRRRGIKTEVELPLPIAYDGLKIDAGYRIDLRVDRRIIVENKTVDHVLPIHEAQLLTYLRLSGCQVGFILNWKVRRMRDGIRRMVWHYR